MDTAWSCIFSVCLGTILLSGCSSPDEKANKLYVEASGLLTSAREVERTSYSDALKIYKDALEKINKIITEYPSSTMAVTLVQNKEKVKLESLVNKVIKKANAEQDVLTCAFFILELGGSSGHRATGLAKIACKYAKAGQQEKASEMFSQALELAKTVESDILGASTLSYLASQYAEAGKYDEAITLCSHALGIVKPVEKLADDKVSVLIRIGMYLCEGWRQE